MFNNNNKVIIVAFIILIIVILLDYYVETIREKKYLRQIEEIENIIKEKQKNQKRLKDYIKELESKKDTIVIIDKKIFEYRKTIEEKIKNIPDDSDSLRTIILSLLQ